MSTPADREKKKERGRIRDIATLAMGKKQKEGSNNMSTPADGETEKESGWMHWRPPYPPEKSLDDLHRETKIKRYSDPFDPAEWEKKKRHPMEKSARAEREKKLGDMAESALAKWEKRPRDMAESALAKWEKRPRDMAESALAEALSTVAWRETRLRDMEESALAESALAEAKSALAEAKSAEALAKAQSALAERQSALAEREKKRRDPMEQSALAEREKKKRDPMEKSALAFGLVLSSIVRKLEKLGDLLDRKAGSLRVVRTYLELVKSAFEELQTFQKYAEAKSDDWTWDVRNLSYVAEDVIDCAFLSETTERDNFGILGIINDAQSELYRQISSLKSKIQESTKFIWPYSTKYLEHEEERSAHGESGSRDPRLLSLYVEKSDFVGFQQDQEKLMQQLMQEDHLWRSVTSIVGMEGQGKTSLARKLYECDAVKHHFAAASAWVSVNENVRELFQDIAEQVMDMPKEDSAELNIKDLQQRLSEFLSHSHRRYLIVLDDMWKEDVWDELDAALPDAKNGSRIMLTTPSLYFATAADPANPPYELPRLTIEESWKLFLQNAFPRMTGEITCPDQLEEIGRLVVAKCNGLPLAIELIGGLIAARGEGNVADWKHVLYTLNEHFPEEPIQCTDILAFCYSDLPYYLKPCFLYLCLFPKGRKVDAEKLMMLWVVESFIELRGEHAMEDVVKSYFLELIGRNMIQVAEREWDGQVVTCCIHDLLRDLAISEARQHHFLEIDFEVSDSTSFSSPRVAIHSETTDGPLKYSTEGLRSILLFTRSDSILKLRGRNYVLLRVLDLEGVKVEEEMLDLFISGLIHLKYLNLRRTSIRSLPPSIGNLCNLETLLLDYDTCLPEAIWKLRRLRHLHALDCDFEGQPRLEYLNNLHTLCLSSGDWIEEKSLSSLGGIRILKVAGDVCARLKVLWSSIDKLILLQSLVLSESFVGNAQVLPSLAHHMYLHEMVLAVPLERLPEPNEFPRNLTKLVLDRSGLDDDPMPTLEKLENLQILQLSSNVYQGKKMISSAHGFPQLLRLTFLCLDELVEWIVEEGAMSKLEHLSISVCPNLNMLPEGLQYITTLKELETWDISMKLYDRLQERKGVDWWKIKHVSYLRIHQ